MKKMLLFLRFVLWEYASRLARFRLCAVSSRPSSAFRPAVHTEGLRRDGRRKRAGRKQHRIRKRARREAGVMYKG